MQKEDLVELSELYEKYAEKHDKISDEIMDNISSVQMKYPGQLNCEVDINHENLIITINVIMKSNMSLPDGVIDEITDNLNPISKSIQPFNNTALKLILRYK